MLRLPLCLLVVLAACGDNITPPFPKSCEPGQPDAPRVVSLWIQDDPDLGAAEALTGCDMWEPKCLQCQIAPTEKAAAGLYVSHEDCVAKSDGSGYVLAFSLFGGKITIIMECVRELFATDPDGHPSRAVLAEIIGHELGHEAGMWWHVPYICDEASTKDDFEKDLIRMGVCGKALMNAYIDTNVTAITPVDKDAFDLRDAGHSTFPHFAATETATGCVLTYRPAP